MPIAKNYGTVLYGIVLYGTVLYGTVLYGIVPHYKEAAV